MLRLGKYRGLKFEEAAEHDRSYAAWVLRERALPKTLGDYRQYLHETRGGILNIGKHRGKWFKEVVEQDPRHGGRGLEGEGEEKVDGPQERLSLKLGTQAGVFVCGQCSAKWGSR